MIRYWLCLLLCLVSGAAQAGAMADAARDALEAGEFAQGDKQLSEALKVDPADNEARIGLGLVRFAAAVERFGQAQHRYGLRQEALKTPLALLGGSGAFSVAPTETFDRLSYEQQRAVLQRLLDDLAQVDDALAPMGDRDAKVTIDLAAIQFHLAPGAPRDPQLTLGAILQVTQWTPHASSAPNGVGPTETVFDRADALWLRAYAHFLSAAIELPLAYDWRDSFDRYAGLFYWGAKPPPPPYEYRGTSTLLDDDIFDLIGFVHSARWRCVEPERFGSAKRHLKMVVALNRAMWPLILARAGDDKNWLPGPQQRGASFVGLPVTDEIVATWRSDIETFDAVLDGSVLLPHWRYAWGIDLGKIFDHPPDFDALDWLAGPPAVPYLRDGLNMDAHRWGEITEPFGPNFLAYLLWFN